MVNRGRFVEPVPPEDEGGFVHLAQPQWLSNLPQQGPDGTIFDDDAAVLCVGRLAHLLEHLAQLPDLHLLIAKLRMCLELPGEHLIEELGECLLEAPPHGCPRLEGRL